MPKLENSNETFRVSFKHCVLWFALLSKEMTEGKLLKRAIIVLNIVVRSSPASHFPLTSCTIVPKYSVHIKVILCRLGLGHISFSSPYCAVGSNCDTISWIQWRGSYERLESKRITRLFSVNAFFLLLDVVPQVIFRASKHCCHFWPEFFCDRQTSKWSLSPLGLGKKPVINCL